MMGVILFIVVLGPGNIASFVIILSNLFPCLFPSRSSCQSCPHYFKLTHPAVSPFKVVETSQQDYANIGIIPLSSHLRSLYLESVRSMKKCRYHCSFSVVGFVVMYFCFTFTDVVVGLKPTIYLVLTHSTIRLYR